MRNLVVGGVIALSLAGCTLTLAEPPPPEGAELQGYIEEQQSRALSYEVVDGVTQVTVTSESCFERAQQFLENIDVTTLSDEEVVVVSAQFEAAMADCDGGVLVSPNEAGFFSSAQLGYLYDYFQDSLVPCLQAQGLEVGFAPSRLEFASSAGWIQWDPYSELGAALPPTRSAEIRSRCPEYPPAEFLGAR